MNTSQTQVAFTWSAPASNGGSAVIDYIIIWDQGTGTYIQAAAGITTTSFTKTGLSAGTTYNFKVQARNVVGVGSLTSAFSIVAAVVPGVPTSLTRDNVNTTKTQVAFTWLAPADNGGIAIIDYSILWDQGTSTYVSLATGVTALTYTKNGLAAGTTYKFKV